MVRLCNDLLELQAREARKRRLFAGRDLSIDLYDVVYHGRVDEHVFHVYRDVKGKMRPSHRYGLASVTGRGFFFSLGILPIARGDSGGKTVDWLLGRSLETFRPRTVLMDRGFYSLEVFEAVEDRDLKYIVPGKSGDRMDELYKESLLRGKSVSEYMMYGKKNGGRAWKRLTVFFQEDPEFEYNSYFTNHKINEKDVEQLALRYAKRGNIENNIKAKNHVKPRTSSTHLQYRFLLQTISLILTNLWRYLVITLRLQEEKEMPVTQDSFNHILKKILETKTSVRT